MGIGDVVSRRVGYCKDRRHRPGRQRIQAECAQHHGRMGETPAILRAGPRTCAGRLRPLRRRPGGIRRYRALFLGNAAWSRLRAVRQVHGRAVHHSDGRRATRQNSPLAAAGVFVAKSEPARIAHHRDHRGDARPNRERRQRVRRNGRLRRATRRRRAVDRDGQSGRAAQEDIPRLSRGAAAHDLYQSRASRLRRNASRLSRAPPKR